MRHDREALRAAVESALAEARSRRGILEVWAKSGRWHRARLVPRRGWERAEAHEVGVACRWAEAHRATFAAASGTNPAAGREAAQLALAAPPLSPAPLPPAAALGAAVVPAPPTQLADDELESVGRAVAARLVRRGQGQPELVELRVLQGRSTSLLARSDGFTAGGETAAAVVEAVFLGEDGPPRRVHRALATLAGIEPAALARVLLGDALLPRGRSAPRRQLGRVLLSPAVAAALLTAAARRPLAERSRRSHAPARLVDDRTGAAGLGGLPCDGEGLPARAILLSGADAESPATWLDARRGEGTPGGATRVSYREPPCSAPANLVLAATALLPAAELVAALGDGFAAALPVGEVAVEPRTGSFELAVTGSLVRAGHPTAGVPAARLRGSLARLLAGIEACGGEAESFSLDCAVTTPAVLLRSLEIG